MAITAKNKPPFEGVALMASSDGLSQRQFNLQRGKVKIDGDIEGITSQVICVLDSKDTLLGYKIQWADRGIQVLRPDAIQEKAIQDGRFLPFDFINPTTINLQFGEISEVRWIWENWKYHLARIQDKTRGLLGIMKYETVGVNGAARLQYLNEEFSG